MKDMCRFTTATLPTAASTPFCLTDGDAKQTEEDEKDNQEKQPNKKPGIESNDSDTVL